MARFRPAPTSICPEAAAVAPESTKVGSSSAKAGPTKSLCPKPARSDQHWLGICPNWPELGQLSGLGLRPNTGLNSANSRAGTRPDLRAGVRPTEAWIRPNLARFRPWLRHDHTFGPNSTPAGPLFPTCGWSGAWSVVGAPEGGSTDAASKRAGVSTSELCTSCGSHAT